jgi:hypothetical protein
MIHHCIGLNTIRLFFSKVLCTVLSITSTKLVTTYITLGQKRHLNENESDNISFHTERERSAYLNNGLSPTNDYHYTLHSNMMMKDE